ncbi:MAG: apolipoprotein N-acyltransferase [Acidiferrobacterales bacterium]|nr:apolipoprotein N-acyltransferase [Acidiferrobacterales bacterium]
MAAIYCLLAGLASVLAFQPFGIAAIIYICLAVLFYFLQTATSKRQAFLYGFSFGFGLFGAGVSWVYVSLSTYGGMPLWMGGIAVLGFVGLLATFIGLVGFCAVLLIPNPGIARFIVIPPCWIIFEWIKSWILTGFPWLEVGYSQTSTWLFSLAPIGGVYLIGFFVASLSCLLVLSVKHRYRWFYRLILVLVIVSLWPLNQIDWSRDHGAPITIGLVQGNVPIESKWYAEQRDTIIGLYASQSRELHQQTPIDLFVWPETALPLYLQQTDPVFWNSIIPEGTALMTGIMDQVADSEFYNAAILSCDGQQQIYRKRHLVPFGEYLPLRFLFDWVLDYLQLPMSDFSSWQGPQRLSCPNNIDLSLSICYEDAFGSEWRQYVFDATLLVNISEDAWFGDSLAPMQRLQMAQMRAKEFSKPLVRSANTGPSVVIDQRGKVLDATNQFVQESLSYSVQPQIGKTWYQRFGNWIVFLSIGLVALLLLRSRGAF